MKSDRFKTTEETVHKSRNKKQSETRDPEMDRILEKLLALIEKNRRIRTKQAASLFRGTESRKKTLARGFLKKKVEEGMLVEFADEENTTWYVLNKDGYYTPEELYGLVPEKERQRILAHITNEPITTSRLAHLLYGSDKRGLAFLETFLNHYVNLGLVQFKIKKTGGGWCLTERGQELGVDAQSLKTLRATALENALFVKEEGGRRLPESLAAVRESLQKDIAGKTVPVIDFTDQTKDKDLKLVFIGEVLYGSQYTDQDLLEWVLSVIDNPSFVITSGLVQGRFEVKNKAKTRMLAEEGGLHRIEAQFHAAGMLLDWLERIVTEKVCVIQSDDDWRLADDYATLMHLAEGKNPWKWGVNWSSFSAEMKRRLENQELRRKLRTQWEIIQAYMYRIGRSLLNRDEVFAKIGVRKSEYRLIIEIMVAKRHGFDYPKEYEQVVNVDALYGNINKRIVTPDTLRLKVAVVGDSREIRIVHNAGFSDITQYTETIQHLDAIARHIGLKRYLELPWILADFHQESFFAEYLMGTWIMNLPGMQNTTPAAIYTLKQWNTMILEAKERRQSRVRKEPVSPAAVEMILCSDGRIRFRILNDTIRRVLEDQKDEKEKREILVVGTDTQFGSITMWPEFTAKFFDYALYTRGAQHLVINGDLIHGYIYPQHVAENRDVRLTTLHSQQLFAFELLMPILIDAPNLRDLAAWLGNHEWNNLSAKYQGDNPLTFLETALKGVMMERRRVGTQSALETAMTISRIRWRNTHNPASDIINWPLYINNICGFRVAIQHMWQPFAGKTPANEGKKWLRNMAKAARDIDIIIGGDKHSVWMAQVADKLIVQAGAAAGQSGYELARGLMSTVMFTLVEFSNREGIIVEFVPWEFLAQYKFQCPTYRGKDAQFVRPLPGTDEYKRGKMSPFIERLIDSLTVYLER